MFENMFGRLVALFVAVILLITLIGGITSIVSTRNAMTENRMEILLKEARDIAFFASEYSESSTSYPNMTSASASYLQRKADEVYDEYNAYILILDKSGHVLDNMKVAAQDGIEALETLNSEQVKEALLTVLEGIEVTTTIKSSTGPIFTVAVPWTENDEVQGAVFIHTSSQIIQSEYRHFLFQLILGFALAVVMAVIGTIIYTKGVTKPLTAIAHAAEEMSQGKLSTRAEITGVSEVRQLAGSFNVMAEKLEMNEESRKEFVANVSHELRSPVTSIHGFVEGMLDGTIPMEEAAPYLQIVYDETNRMKRLISDLLQLSRMDKGVEKLEKSNFDIHELIRRVIIERMADMEAKSIEPSLDFFEDSCIVTADKDRISQVVHNIVDNALKYLSVGGHLTITTSLVHDGIVAVKIENDGEPIAQEDRPHIFDRFYKAEKAHTSGKGTGLGLSISKQIMEMHGQILELTNPETGAGFRFTLPLAAGRGGYSRLNPGK